MSNITSLKRYIDDGKGFFSRTKRQYSDGIDKINQKINKYGLTIIVSPYFNVKSPQEQYLDQIKLIELILAIYNTPYFQKLHLLPFSENRQ